MAHSAPKLCAVKDENPYGRPTPTDREGIFTEQRQIGDRTTTNSRPDDGKFMTSNLGAQKCKGLNENDRGDKGQLHSWFYVSNVYSYIIAVVRGGG